MTDTPLHDSAAPGTRPARAALLLLALVAAAGSPASAAIPPAPIPNPKSEIRNPQSPPAPYRFAHDHILGTSLDLAVHAPDEASARAVEAAVLAEVERLRLILSTWDPASEISRLLQATGPTQASPELLDVLEMCEKHRLASGGAFNANLGRLVALWTDAEKADRLPDPAALGAAVGGLSAPAWTIDRAAAAVTLAPGARPNVDGLAKGFILDKAVAAARARVPAVAAIVLEIGGDVLVWGRPADAPPGPWADIDVADPQHSADNDPPLARVRVASGAVTSSGHSARHYTIGGRRYSHILDPRTGRPAGAVAGATVFAPDAATADALATALCVLAPAEGLRLLATTPGTEGLIVASDGRRLATAGWKAMEVPLPATASNPPAPASNPAAGTPATGPAAGPAAKPATWPTGRQLTVTLTLPKRRGRPYVAVWAEDAAGRPVRTLALWGRNPKYLRDLKTWWRIGSAAPDLVQAVARASRAPGRYELAWDGKDDQGRPVPAGTYTVRVETAREDGPHTELAGAIACADAPASVTLAPNAEVVEVVLAYGPPPAAP